MTFFSWSNKLSANFLMIERMMLTSTMDIPKVTTTMKTVMITMRTTMLTITTSIIRTRVGSKTYISEKKTHHTFYDLFNEIRRFMISIDPIDQLYAMFFINYFYDISHVLVD